MSHPGAYKLSLGHIKELTINSLAYLRLPLAVAGVALLVGVLGNLRWTGRRAFLASARMMEGFYHAARLAMVVFDLYLSSRPIAEALLKAPPGQLLVDHHYYTFSSIIFYINRSAPLVNARRQNLEYRSYALGPDVFLTDSQLAEDWHRPERNYLVADHLRMLRFQKPMGAENVNVVISSGRKIALTNHPFAGTQLPRPFEAGGCIENLGELSPALAS